MNLKSQTTVFLFVLILGTIVYFSFKHDRAGFRDTVSATDAEREDQIRLSAMHSESAPLASPSPQASTSALQTMPASPADLAKLAILQEVLETRNDNDPRLDKELRNLSPEAKALMRGQYSATPNEKRNARGTIVYLVGRELATAEDVGFLRSVLHESPCLSMSDCSREERASVSPDEHHQDTANEVTLAYPQLVALRSIDSYLNRPGGGPLSEQLRSELEAARRSPVRKVAAMAEEIARKHAEKQAQQQGASAGG